MKNTGNKNGKASAFRLHYQENLTRRITILSTILVSMPLVAFLLFSVTPTISNGTASALTKSKTIVSIEPVASIAIEAYDYTTSSYTSSNNMSMNINPDSFNTMAARVSTSTNSPIGLTLYLNDTDTNNALVEQHDNQSSPVNPVISSITTNTTIADTTDSTKAFPINYWGYAFNTTSNNTTTPPTIPLTYSSIPTSETLIAETSTNGDSAYTFTAGSRIDMSLPAGVYKDQLTFTVLANAVPDTRTIFDLDFMQEMNTTICRNTPTPVSTAVGDNSIANSLAEITIDPSTNKANKVPSTSLIDERDGQSYTIRKLADGNCWMTENLRLGKNGAITLTSEKSNMAGDRTFTLPAAVAPADAGSWGNQSKTKKAIYRNENEPLNKAEADAHAGTGAPLNTVLYNWYTATAGARSSSDSTIGDCNDDPELATNCGSLMAASSGQATDSVCPKGWQLPVNEGGDGEGRSFSHLVRTYTDNGNNRGGTEGVIVTDLNKLHSAPISLVYSDHYARNGVLFSRSVGYYWSSAANSATDSRHLSLDFYSTYLYLAPQSSSPKGSAFAVRCVAQ